MDVLPGSAQSVLSTNGIPLSAALSATARAANERLWILPGTPNPPQVGSVVGTTPREALARLLDLNGLVAREHNGVLVVGTPLAMDARFGSGTAHARLVPVVGLDPQVVVQTLAPQLPAGTVILPDTARHALYVSGTTMALRQVESFVAPLNQRQPDVVRYPLHSSADPAQVTALLEKVAPPAAPESVVVDPAGGAVLVAGPPGYQGEVSAALAQIDRDPAQVKYHISVIEVDPVQLAHNVGISVGQSQTQYQAVGQSAIGQLSSPAQGQAIFAFPLNHGLSLNGELDLLESHGQARFIRDQDITVVNGTQGVADFTEQLPYQVTTQNGFSVTTGTQYQSFGFTIKLTPQIGDSTIGTTANVVYSTLAGFGVGGAPITTTRGMTTRVTTTDGQTFLVGGLKAEDFTTTASGIPILDRLPLLGALFRHAHDQDNQQELVMVISAQRIGAVDAIDTSRYPHVAPYVLASPLPGGKK
ncbi:hypothetical protein EPN42_04760 [bacterium]|nr:MAG: hypothetical protein EPN42_04760 [bacterium]